MTEATLSAKSSDVFLEGASPYSLGPAEKERFLLERLEALTEEHAARCPEYGRFVADWFRHRSSHVRELADLPYLPVNVFKEFRLRSNSEGAFELSSSATTSGSSSKVYADKITRRRQSRSANMIWTDFVGSQRRPYLVFDTESTVRGTAGMNARGAAIMSLVHLSSTIHFVATQDGDGLQLDAEALDRALQEIGEDPFLAYGFTYILYDMHEQLRRSGELGRTAHPESAILHSGGWKRMQSRAVDKSEFNRAVAGTWGLAPRQVIDFYGLVEQVGVPYPDCSAGYKHPPYWADVLIRRADDCRPAAVGETGLIQLVNCLPLSGPNHNVLTEDLGEIVLEDGCPCGRRGRAFVFRGRAPQAETRGCSDVGGL